MATVTSQNTAVPPAIDTGTRSSEKVSQNYKVRLDVRGDEQILTGSDTKIFPIVANLPERYNIDFSSSWSSPFSKSDVGSAVGGSMGEKAMAAFNVAGIGTKLKAQSVQVWDSTSAMEFSIQMVFNAENNTRQDVRDKHRALLKLCAPSEKLGVLIQPGPTIAGQAAGAVGGMLGISDNSRRITLYVGNYLRLDNVIITGVSSDVSTLCDIDGNPINMTINVTMQSFYSCFTTSDIDNMFNTN